MKISTIYTYAKKMANKRITLHCTLDKKLAL